MAHPAALGVDVGSTTWKGVVLDEKGMLLTSLVEDTESLLQEQAKGNLDRLLQEVGVASLPLGATGYGRRQVPGATRVVTEITCHARGAYHQQQQKGTLLDIGGQDTKAIRISQKGTVDDFAMNDKCAAGTGRFLEVILQRLQVAPHEVEQRISGSKPTPISSTCTVFAESEIISLIAQGVALGDILHGVHLAFAERVVSLVRRLQPAPPFWMSGGVALHQPMVQILARLLGQKLLVLQQPQLVGAIGAALSVLPP